MVATHEALNWRGREMVDPRGEPIGRIEAIYLDFETDVPEWALVVHGRFGGRPTFVPLEGVVADAGAVRAPFDRDAVEEAPSVDPDEELSQDAELALSRHYGLGAPAAPARDADAPEADPAKPEHGLGAHRAEGGTETPASPGTPEAAAEPRGESVERKPEAKPAGERRFEPAARDEQAPESPERTARSNGDLARVEEPVASVDDAAVVAEAEAGPEPAAPPDAEARGPEAAAPAETDEAEAAETDARAEAAPGETDEAEAAETDARAEAAPGETDEAEAAGPAPDAGVEEVAPAESSVDPLAEADAVSHEAPGLGGAEDLGAAAGEAPPVTELEDEDARETTEDEDALDDEQLHRLETTRARYRMHAPTYDFQTAALEPSRERAVEALGLRPGDVVLDVGCGTGNAFGLLESAIGPSGRILGLDLSAEMLERARARAAASGWENVDLLETSAEEAALTEPVDAALFVFVHDVLRSPRALERTLAMVRPGGRVVAVGAKWAPWWAPAVNSYVVTVASSFVTSFEGFDQPWTQLERHVPDLRIEELSFGSAFLASGTVPGAEAR